MVSVFPGRFVTEPQKAPALTRSQTVKAVTGKSRGRRREQGRAEEGEGRERRRRRNEQGADKTIKTVNNHNLLEKKRKKEKSLGFKVKV